MVNPRVRNPCLKDNGSRYLEELDGKEDGVKQLLSATVVGDGGVSWRIKALKRAQEQATIDGQKLQKVFVERRCFDKETVDRIAKGANQTSKKDVTQHHPKMRVPVVHDSLSWGKRVTSPSLTERTNLNKFSNDGSFMDGILLQNAGTMKPSMSANKLAAKAMQLRMKGKHEEAEKLLKEAEEIKVRQDPGNESSRIPTNGTAVRSLMHDVSLRQLKKEEDADLILAKNIIYNQNYSELGLADEEYGYDDGPRRKIQKKGDANQKLSEINWSAKRILTQPERCQFCFENPSRPKHLVIAIANFTYQSLPQQQPIVPGHCSILTLQHESSTRTVDDIVWNEIRNFKKCLVMMFAKQGKDVLFLETVKGLAQQRRHCMVECIPLPPDVARQAPAYFKKAIDEAEAEWSQHDAKKLIDTSKKGLQASIPKNFPYFHIEFGLDKGFVHVIDNEKDFSSSFGINVVRGMLRLPAEDRHQHQMPGSVQSQSFARDWEPFDWTKQLA